VGAQEPFAGGDGVAELALLAERLGLALGLAPYGRALPVSAGSGRLLGPASGR